MRTYSLFTIFLLCLAILLVDVLAFYWLHSITELIDSNFIRKSIHILFWIFSFGLITGIIILKLRLDNINPTRKHWFVSSLFGLTISSFIPKLIFVFLITILYFTNYFVSETTSLIIVPLAGLFSGFFPFFVILYGIFKSKYNFKIHSHSIKFKKLPASFNGLKIVQISDIHLGSFNYQYHILERAIKKMNDLQPDYVFITGDLVNNFAWELRGWDKIFNKIKAKKGKFSILGNHDYGDYSEWNSSEEKEKNFDAIKDFYKKTGFQLLLNEAKVIDAENGEKISIIGVENWGKPPFKKYGNLNKAIEKIKETPFKILLSHDPTHWVEEVIPKTDIDLTLSGHTHGMQAGFQYKNLQWSPIKFKYKHWAGLYQKGEQFLYVNRGLGWLGFPGRLGMRPEITLLELRE